MAAITLDTTEHPASVNKITGAAYLFLKDAPLILGVSLVAHSCFAILSLGLSAPFSFAAFAAIVLKGSSLSLLSNSVWNATAGFFNFSLKRAFTWFNGNEKLRSFLHSESDQFFFGPVMKSIKIFFAVINVTLISKLPTLDIPLRKYVITILGENLLFMSVATLIFASIISLAVKMVDGPAGYINSVIDNHLNNVHLPLSKKNEFKEKMKHITDEFKAQTAQLVVLDLISSSNTAFPTFVGEIENINDAALDLRTSFLALSSVEKDMIENRVRIDPKLGKLSAGAKVVWTGLKDFARNLLLQNNGYFDAALKHALINRSNES